MAAPSELTRYVATAEGAVVAGRHAPGRGAWLCTGSAACATAAVKRRAFARALRRPVDPVSVTAALASFSDSPR